MFKMTHPILGTRDIKRAIEFYTQRLGFQLAFGDKTDPPNYVGFRRDAVELHMQFQFEHEMGTIRLRFLVEDPDALFSEYWERGVECSASGIRDTPWGTREFALTTWIGMHSPSTAACRAPSGSRNMRPDATKDLRPQKRSAKERAKKFGCRIQIRP